MKRRTPTSLCKRALCISAATTLLYALYAYARQATEDRAEFYGHGFNTVLFKQAYWDYLEQHRGNFPPMGSTSAFIAAIAREPRFSGKTTGEVEALFVQQTNGKPYHINGWLSGKNLEDLPNSQGFVAFYEDAFDNTANTTFERAFHVPNSRPRFFVRAVMYANGRVNFINENEWLQIKRQSHME